MCPLGNPLKQVRELLPQKAQSRFIRNRSVIFVLLLYTFTLPIPTSYFSSRSMSHTSEEGIGSAGPKESLPCQSCFSPRGVSSRPTLEQPCMKALSTPLKPHQSSLIRVSDLLTFNVVYHKADIVIDSSSNTPQGPSKRVWQCISAASQANDSSSTSTIHESPNQDPTCPATAYEFSQAPLNEDFEDLPEEFRSLRELYYETFLTPSEISKSRVVPASIHEGQCSYFISKSGLGWPTIPTDSRPGILDLTHNVVFTTFAGQPINLNSFKAKGLIQRVLEKPVEGGTAQAYVFGGVSCLEEDDSGSFCKGRWVACIPPR
jgi:hypothetical protein